MYDSAMHAELSSMLTSRDKLGTGVNVSAVPEPVYSAEHCFPVFSTTSRTLVTYACSSLSLVTSY